MLNIHSDLVDLIPVIGTDAYATISVIAKRIGKKKTSWPSKFTLRKEVGISRDKLDRALKILVDNSLIEIQQTRKTDPVSKKTIYSVNTYKVTTKFISVFVNIADECDEDNKEENKNQLTDFQLTDFQHADSQLTENPAIKYYKVLSIEKEGSIGETSTDSSNSVSLPSVTHPEPQPSSDPTTNPTISTSYQEKTIPVNGGAGEIDLLDYLVQQLPKLSGHPALRRILTVVEERAEEARDFIDYVASQKTSDKYIQVNLWKFFVSDFWEFKQKGGKLSESFEGFEVTAESLYDSYHGERREPLTGLEHLQIKMGVIEAPEGYDPIDLNKVYKI